MFAIFGKIRDVRLIALFVKVVAVARYLAPYLVGAIECVSDTTLPVKQCLSDIYDEARGDTNLAAGIIALAVILAAWRPVPEESE